MKLPDRRFTSAVPSRLSRKSVVLAARSPSGKGKPAKPAPARAKRPPAARPTPPQQPAKKAPEQRPERLALRQMGRGRKPAILPDTPALPPPPPTPPDFKGAAPTMHYGEAPVPPKKKSKNKTAAPRSTAARAAEAARAAVWSVSSPKTTAQIEAAENAFEVVLNEHKAREEAHGDIASPVLEVAPPPPPAKKGKKGAKAAEPVEPKRPAVKDRWTIFREELAREDDPSDPHHPWRRDTGRNRHEMFLPATEEQLVQVEKDLKLALPPSYRDFNLHWGGGRLYTQEWRETRVVGALDLQRELKNRLCDRMHAPFVPLADLGDGDYLAFDTSKPNAKGEFPVYWWYGGHVKKKVSASFHDWLDELIAHEGEAFWWGEE